MSGKSCIARVPCVRTSLALHLVICPLIHFGKYCKLQESVNHRLSPCKQRPLRAPHNGMSGHRATVQCNVANVDCKVLAR